MCSARGYGDILGLRFGVGAAEALLQATPLYLVLWYGRNELGKRIGKSIYSIAMMDILTLGSIVLFCHGHCWSVRRSYRLCGPGRPRGRC